MTKKDILQFVRTLQKDILSEDTCLSGVDVNFDNLVFTPEALPLEVKITIKFNQ